jgi:hypothetical protein
MRVINSAARSTVLRELALLRALCASLRDSRRPARLAAKGVVQPMRAPAAAGAKSPPPVPLPTRAADLVLGGPR